MVVEVTLRYEFDAAHRLPNHPGKCRHLHGHRYVAEVTVTGQVDEETGMICDFADLKKAIKDTIGPWDHSLLLHKDDREWVPDPHWNQHRFDLPPTAEWLATVAAILLEKPIGQIGASLVSVRLFETPNCWVTVTP